MDSKTIAVLAALDTKAPEARFIAEVIKQRGHLPLMIDTGVLKDPQESADVPSRELAAAGGVDLEALRRTGDKALAMDVMVRGAAVVAANLYATGRFHGVIGIGGSAGTAIGSSAMRALPLGIPKLLVSTMAAG